MRSERSDRFVGSMELDMPVTEKMVGQQESPMGLSIPEVLKKSPVGLWRGGRFPTGKRRPMSATQPSGGVTTRECVVNGWTKALSTGLSLYAGSRQAHK